MAGYGNTIPKADGERRRRNKRDPETPLPAPKAVRKAPRMPSRGDGLTWQPATRGWWRAWATSPQSAEFLATDWAFLLETAALVDAFWRGDATVAAEIRLRVAKLGGTVEDRRRLRLKIEESPKPEAPARPASRYAHLRPA